MKCPKCKRPIRNGQAVVQAYIVSDPGDRPLYHAWSSLWSSLESSVRSSLECAKALPPYDAGSTPARSYFGGNDHD